MAKLQVGINDLETWCKNNGDWGAQLMREWVGEDEDGNKIKMCEMSRASGKRVYWSCSYGHSWVARVTNRTINRTCCPTCNLESHSKALLHSGKNDLETWCDNNGEWGIQLRREWYGEDVDSNKISMSDVAKSSHRKVKWHCECGNIWVARVNDRTDRLSRCPICFGNNALYTGVNDLETWCKVNGDYGTQLMQEWVGRDEDGNVIKMCDVAKSSHKKVKWCCSQGHSWLAEVGSRTREKGRTGCPVCGLDTLSRKMSESRLIVGVNDLETWCKNNGEWGLLLIKEWVGVTEDNCMVNMHDVAFASSRRFKWHCSEGHEWYATAGSRVRGTRCPRCANVCRGISRRSTELSSGRSTSLEVWCSGNGMYGRQVQQEWTGITNTGQHFELSDVSRGCSSLIFKWKCVSGHEWEARVNARTRGSTCPYCAGKAASAEYNLESWCLDNEWGIRLYTEFVGEDEHGNLIQMRELTPYSNRKVLWRCSNGHRWYATVCNRVANFSGCPECLQIGTSYPELYLYFGLEQLYQDVRHRKKYFKSVKYPHGLEYDISMLVDDVPILMEYSGTYWHEGKEERDADKKVECDKHNVRFIQIIEDSYNELDEQWQDNYICFHMVQSKRNELLKKILSHILGTLGRSIDEVDFDKVEADVLNFMSGSEEEGEVEC